MKDSNIELKDNNNGFILSEKKESIYGLLRRQFRFSAFTVCFAGTYQACFCFTKPQCKILQFHYLALQSLKQFCTGKSFSEALILPTTNPQYDKRLFIELPVQYMKIPSSEHVENMLCTQIVFCFCSDIQNNLSSKHVLSLKFSFTELVIQ